jgi:hypothetical protein
MIYTAQCIMYWMHAYPLYLGKWEGGWALEIESFLGPVKWHQADRLLPVCTLQLLLNANTVSTYVTMFT